VALGLGVPAVIAGIVATVCAVLAVASRRALVRTGNRAIHFVVLAFAVMSAKNLAKAISLGSGARESPEIELLFTLLDLSAVGLFAWPILTGGSVARR
jgi:Fe2+ transport system protein B